MTLGDRSEITRQIIIRGVFISVQTRRCVFIIYKYIYLILSIPTYYYYILYRERWCVVVVVLGWQRRGGGGGSLHLWPGSINLPFLRYLISHARQLSSVTIFHLRYCLCVCARVLVCIYLSVCVCAVCTCTYIGTCAYYNHVIFLYNESVQNNRLTAAVGIKRNKRKSTWGFYFTTIPDDVRSPLSPAQHRSVDPPPTYRNR